ncbi:platelet endothelial aggregation receptor 1-like [Orbicella faveolata]|uniref:platelet endothelial aggregation receptor 1-like n=1 Tax=Orbicella faveolata TaxID=48498 RepID=UPI0009E4CD0E|nr:platelet endothelial aggregation receptor 1-like [Orbicella faveolata]
MALGVTSEMDIAFALLAGLEFYVMIRHVALDCPPGFYGAACQEQCACAHMELCHPETGTCQCDPGFFGARCAKECPSGYFGAGCKEMCKCQVDHTERCHPENGACHCKPGYQGKYCTESKYQNYAWKLCGPNCFHM